MALPAIPFLAVIWDWIATQIFRFLVMEVILFLLGIGLIYFADEIRELIKENVLDPINGAINDDLNEGEKIVFAVISDFKDFVITQIETIEDLYLDVIDYLANVAEPQLQSIVDLTELPYQINIDALLALPELASKVDAVMETMLDTIGVSLGAYLEGVLNPIRQGMIFIQDSAFSLHTSLTAVQTDFNATITEQWNTKIEPIKVLVTDALAIWNAAHNFLDVKNSVAIYSASLIKEGDIITPEYIANHKQLIAEYVDNITIDMSQALATPPPPPDFTAPDFIQLDLTESLTQIKGIQDKATFSIDLVNGVIGGVQAWLAMVLAAKIRLQLAEFIKGFFLVAWAVEFDKYRADLKQKALDLKADFEAYRAKLETDVKTKFKALKDLVIAESVAYKKAVIAEFDRIRKSIKENGVKIFKKITPDLIKPRMVRLTDKLEEHTSKSKDYLQNVNISDFVDGLENVDSIVFTLNDYNHYSSPISDSEKFILDDMLRILTRNFSRPERIALMLVIANKDLSLNAKQFYEDVLQFEADKPTTGIFDQFNDNFGAL